MNNSVTIGYVSYRYLLDMFRNDPDRTIKIIVGDGNTAIPISYNRASEILSSSYSACMIYDKSFYIKPIPYWLTERVHHLLGLEDVNSRYRVWIKGPGSNSLWRALFDELESSAVRAYRKSDERMRADRLNCLTGVVREVKGTRVTYDRLRDGCLIIGDHGAIPDELPA